MTKRKHIHDSHECLDFQRLALTAQHKNETSIRHIVGSVSLTL